MIPLSVIECKDSTQTITCDGCGACCLHMSVPPYDEEELEILKYGHPQAYADYLAVMETRTVQLAVVGTDFIPCGFFDMVTRRCRHHEVNPVICEMFEVGGIVCLETRKDAGL